MHEVYPIIQLFCPMLTREIRIGTAPVADGQKDCRACEHFNGISTGGEFFILDCGYGAEKPKRKRKKAK